MDLIDEIKKHGNIQNYAEHMKNEPIKKKEEPVLDDKTAYLLKEAKVLKKHKTWENYIEYLEKRARKKDPIKLDITLPKKYREYLRSAIQRKLSFELSVETFEALIADDCFYCGETGGGVDRINSKVGYIEGNVRPCCTHCNVMKFTHTTDDFLTQVNKIHKHLNL